MSPRHPFVVALLLALLLAVCPAAAGQAGKKKSKQPDDRIKLVQCCDLRGADRSFALGMKLAFDEVNAKGGIHGRTFDLKQVDDGGDPKKALELTRDLLDEDRYAMFVGYGVRSATPEVVKLVRGTRTPFYGSPATDPRVQMRNGSYLFHFRPLIEDEIRALVAHVVDKLHLTKISCVYPADEAGKAGLALVEKVLAGREMTLHSTGKHERGSRDVRPALESIAAGATEAVILLGGTTAAMRFVKLCRQRDDLRKAVCVGTSAADPAAFVRALRDEADDCLFAGPVPDPGEALYPVHVDFLAAMKKAKFDKHVDRASLEGYMTAGFLADLVRHEIFEGPLKIEFGPTLRKLHKYSYEGFAVSGGPQDHVASSEVFLTRCIAGTLEPVFGREEAPDPGK